MKANFSTDDPLEIKRIAKSDDLTLAVWEIVHNGWREFKHSDYDYQKAWDKIHQILGDYNIDIDDLME